MRDLEEQAETMPMGTPDEVAERIIDAAGSAGANQVQLALNRGCLPHDLFMNQIGAPPRSPAAPASAHPSRAGCRGGDGLGRSGATGCRLSMTKDLVVIGCPKRKTTAASALLPESLNIRKFVNADEIARGLSPFNPEGSAVRAGRLMTISLRRGQRCLPD